MTKQNTHTNKFHYHRPAQIRKPVQVQETTSIHLVCSEILSMVFLNRWFDHIFTYSESVWRTKCSLVFRNLTELKEKIKDSCSQVTRIMLTNIVQNFVFHLQLDQESLWDHIKHIIHNSTGMLNANPCLLLWYCSYINIFNFINVLLCWK